MLKFIWGLSIFTILSLLTLALNNQESINKWLHAPKPEVQKIKQSSPATDKTGQNSIVDKIIKQSRELKAKNLETEKRIGDFRKNVDIKCTFMVKAEDCEKFIAMLTSDEEVIDIFKKLSKSGVALWIYYSFGTRNEIYLDQNGSLIMTQKADISKIRKFLGLK